MLKLLIAAAAALVLAAPAAAQTDPNRVFPDSKLVVRDRFSDEIVGKGSDLVFIPGLSSSRTTWAETAKRLRGKYRLHLIQIAGFAGEPPRANATGEVLVPTAEALDKYLVEQKLAPAVVVGHSLGGTTALYLALHHPEHLKKVLVVDAWPAFSRTMAPGGKPLPPERIKAMAEQMRTAMSRPNPDPEATRKQLRAQFVGFAVDPARREQIVEWGVASTPAVTAEAFYDDLMLDMTADLPGNRVPITILYPDYAPVKMPAGAQDRIYATNYADMPNKEMSRVDNALHFLMWDQPEVFARELDAFLLPSR